MWNKIAIFALITVIQATNIKQLYGEWMMVAFYPMSANAQICIQYTFSKSPVSTKCVYADGRKATPVQVTMTSERGELLERYSMPMAIVDTPAQVMPALNISCKCGHEEVNDHAVARLVDDNFFIMYHYIPASMESSRTEIEQNAAYLFARNVVSKRELLNVMKSVEDLKRRQGSILCVAENIGVLNHKHELL